MTLPDIQPAGVRGAYNFVSGGLLCCEMPLIAAGLLFNSELTKLHDTSFSSAIDQGAVTTMALPAVSVSGSQAALQLCSDGSWRTAGQCPRHHP